MEPGAGSAYDKEMGPGQGGQRHFSEEVVAKLSNGKQEKGVGEHSGTLEQHMQR